MESAPFFIPSTSYCSLSSWFTSSCAYHLITVTTFTHHLSLSQTFTPDLKLISFTNLFLHSHSYLFRTAFTDLEPVLNQVGTGVVCFSFFFFIFLFLVMCARLSCSHSAVKSRLKSSVVTYRIVFIILIDHSFAGTTSDRAPHCRCNLSNCK